MASESKFQSVQALVWECDCSEETGMKFVYQAIYVKNLVKAIFDLI